MIFLSIYSWDILYRHTKWDKLCTPPSNTERFFMLTIQGTIKKKLISHIYKILKDNPMDDSLGVKEKWELEMNTIISDEKWELSCREGHKATNSHTWKEFEWKVKMKFLGRLLFLQHLGVPRVIAGGAVAWWETIHIYSETVQNYQDTGKTYKKRFQNV